MITSIIEHHPQASPVTFTPATASISPSVLHMARWVKWTDERPVWTARGGAGS